MCSENGAAWMRNLFHGKWCSEIRWKKIKNDGKSEWLQILTSEKYQAQLKKWMATSLI